MGVSRFRDGGVTIELGDELEALARRAADEMLGGLLAKLEAEVGKVLEHARKEWPVVSGDSRDGLTMVTEFSDNGVKVVIENAVPYAKYVRPKKWFESETAWNRLVKKPMAKVGKTIAKEGSAEIAAALRRAGGG